MQFTIRKRRQPPTIIIISLIDILIVLLIFMMVTTTFKQQPALKLVLPESKQTPKTGATEDNLIVTIAKQEPYLYLGPRPVTLDKLQEEFRTHVMACWPEYNHRYAHPFEWTWTNQKMRQWFTKHAPNSVQVL